MGQLPRDPRQLARDILAGKISIEDLAREQVRRRAAGQMPQQVPLRPMQVPPQLRVVPQIQPQSAPRQARQPMTVPPVQRPASSPLPSATAPVRRAVAKVQPRGPVIAVPAKKAPAAAPAAVPSAYTGAGNVAEVQRPSDVQAAEPIATGGTAAKASTWLVDRTQARRAIVLAEILSKPMALRESDPFTF